MSDYRRWTSEEEQYIRDHWKTQSDAEMATALKRMEGAVRAKRRELRCSPQKTWTPEEERYLEDRWGTVSIPGIAKTLERTVSAIKVRAERLGLGGVLDSGDYVTFNQLMIALTDNAKSYSYQMESWVRRRGFPIHTKRVDKCVWRVVYLDEFWKWAEQHRSFIDFSKLEPLALGGRTGLGGGAAPQRLSGVRVAKKRPVDTGRGQPTENAVEAAQVRLRRTVGTPAPF